MKRSMIVAVGPNGEIGCRGGLPWPRIGRDMQWFYTRTRNAAIIMGRHTWNSLPYSCRPLKGRVNIVLTTQVEAFRATLAKASRADRHLIEVASDADEALSVAADRLEFCPDPPADGGEVIVIGGGDVFRQFLASVDTVYLSKISPLRQSGFPDADVFFPYPLNTNVWGEKPAYNRWFLDETAGVRVGFFTYTRR